MGYLTWQVGTASITSNMPLEIYTWTLVTANFVLSTYFSSTAGNAMNLYQNGNVVAVNYVANTGTLSFLATDRVLLGGLSDSFFGSIKDLSIYSPGTLQLNNRNFFIDVIEKIYL